MEGSDHGLFQTQFWHLPRGTEEHHEEPQDSKSPG
jgi:hypothetical protein